MWEVCQRYMQRGGSRGWLIQQFYTKCIHKIYIKELSDAQAVENYIFRTEIKISRVDSE